MKAQKEIFVFVGEKATTGEPNKKTRRMSKWGYMEKFSDMESAKAFYDKKDTGSASQIIEIGTRKSLRKYNLGSSVSDYNFYCDMMQEFEK
jgi:hypothetical protein